jgi:hypothetical protein
LLHKVGNGRQLHANSISIIHDFGCAAIPLGDSGEEPIVLQPWGRVEGTLMIGNRPGANLRVSIRAKPSSELARQANISFNYGTETDGQGRFVFEKVPPGQQVLYRSFSLHPSLPSLGGSSHETEIKVFPSAAS